MAPRFSLQHFLRTLLVIVVVCASLHAQQNNRCCACESPGPGQPQNCNCPPTKTSNGACVCDIINLPGGGSACIKCGTCEPPFGCINCPKKCILCGTENPSSKGTRSTRTMLDEANAEIPFEVNQHPWLKSQELFATVQSHPGAATMARLVAFAQTAYGNRKTITSCMSFLTGGLNIPSSDKPNWWDTASFMLERIGNTWSLVLTDKPVPPDTEENAITKLEVSGNNWRMYHGMTPVADGVFGR